MSIEVSKVTSKGQITIPKTIRQRLNLVEGDKVAFIEDENGKIIITRSSVIALREFLGSISNEALANNITEDELLSDLEQVREEMWNERKKYTFGIFIDSNILISAMFSVTSLSGELLLKLAMEHHLIICSYTINEVSRVLQKRFPSKLAEWDQFLTRHEFELIYTPSDFASFPVPFIRDDKDIPILVSAILSEPDILITGDYDFHTLEIKKYFAVYTPAEFLRNFNHKSTDNNNI